MPNQTKGVEYVLRTDPTGCLRPMDVPTKTRSVLVEEQNTLGTGSGGAQMTRTAQLTNN